ncbi:SDR family oxidoreductase [Aromatoleum aromaticum]|uniref:Probable dehydrogenase n=1 Tax=Aromatoleum aromaticum (strain DSM 19018 / LMG 30748 / EbN1) TaxID=76114 RepID=Q5P560_AROAE|nr:SDR family oxidoreductase [Aromatoleum aromaticum]NMG54771.1 SDR family oxidoreductase [Aromatoleum aromaticum]CAI07552.1 probable dehydrogenase [Aromatoleum aromaticum EbN1]
MLNVLIAGASRGIGLGLARAYLEGGARVFAVARNPAASPGLKELAVQHGERLRVVTCDLNTVSAADEIVTALNGVRLDRAILNAGIYGPAAQDVATASEAEIGQLFFTNAISPLRLARTLHTRLARDAVLGVVSSEMGSLELSKGAESPLYAASKSALNSLLASWAAQLGKARDFTLLALHPGWVQTDMGGDKAPLTVEQSVPGLVAVVEAAAGTRDFRFVDYKGETVPW